MSIAGSIYPAPKVIFDWFALEVSLKFLNNGRGWGSRLFGASTSACNASKSPRILLRLLGPFAQWGSAGGQFLSAEF